jgi:phosphatidylglycerophosphatase GEP4
MSNLLAADFKKPGGAAKEIKSYFDCSASNLVFVREQSHTVTILMKNLFQFSNFSFWLLQVGDRYFTDVVYGNRNGFLTVLTEPLSFPGESYIVRRVCSVFLL